MPKIDEFGTGELANERRIAIGALSGIIGSQKEVFSSMKVQLASASINFTGDLMMAAEMLQKTDVLCIMPKGLGCKSGVLTGTRVLPLQVTLPSRDAVLWCRQTERNGPDVLDFLGWFEKFVQCAIREN